MSARGRRVHVLVGDDIGDREPAAGAQDARGLGEHLGLVRREVDHAVGDHDVDGRVGERDVLDVALEELGVPHAGAGRVGAREGEHLAGHVQPDRPAGGADAAGADQNVRAGAGAEVEDRLARVQGGHGGRHAAAQRRRDRLRRRPFGLARVVQARVEDLGLCLGFRGRRAAARPAGARRRAPGGRGVAVAHGLADLAACARGGQLSHAVSSFRAAGDAE
jgi:hypothetical protein